MLSTSYEFDNLIAESSNVELKGILTLKDGTVRNLVGDDFMMGGMSIDDAVSASSSFDIGAAIINQCTLTLNNYDERFSEYDFTDAKVVPYVGIRKANGTVEWLQKGVYYIEQPSAYPSTITLTALDNMSKFERPYNEVTTQYPATLRVIVMDICAKYGVTLANTNFANSTFSVATRPDDDNLTCLQVIAYAAQASGNYARCDNLGRLRFDWYDKDAFDDETWLDGEFFDAATPYASGAQVDGGNFTSYTSGYAANGGEFDDQRSFAIIHAIASSTICTDDVVITGIRVWEQDEVVTSGEGQKAEPVLYGTEGYVLSIENNPFIPYGKGSEVADRVGPRVVGMRFRPFSAKALGNPAIEAGDPVIVIDARQNTYRSFITAASYRVGAYENYACNAETPSRNSATSFSATTKAFTDMRKDIENEKTAREQAIENLAIKMSAESGLFQTTETMSDGSKVFYMHDQPLLAESKVIWKLTRDAIGISTDGGKTYQTGLDVDGNAILNRVYAIGLDADYITTGALTIKKGNKVMFSADIDTGDVFINSESLSIDTQGIANSIASAKAHYGYCSTGASTQTKQVTCSNFELYTGAMISVRFAYSNTASNPQLSVNGSVAKPIYIYGSAMAADYYWSNYDVLTFVYSGSYWYVSDAGALSKIKATKDGILLTVANTYATYDGIAGTYATKSELTIRADSIESSITEVKAAYGTCSTYSSYTAKIVSCSGFKLYTGATISVYFTYANSASSPTLNVNGTGARSIMMNGSYMTSSNGWNAGDTVTFVYSGTYWRVADCGAQSKITQAVDSITLSVSGSLGGTASITIGKGNTSTSASMNLSNVRSAFANNTVPITISAGTITFNSNTLVVNSTNFSVTSTGVITATSANLQGSFKCGSSWNLLTIANGYITGTRYGSEIGSIGYTASSTDVDTGAVSYGLQITASGIVRISTPRLAIAASSSVSTTATYALNQWTTASYITSIENMSNGGIRWYYTTRTVRYINGICINSGF